MNSDQSNDPNLPEINEPEKVDPALQEKTPSIDAPVEIASGDDSLDTQKPVAKEQSTRDPLDGDTNTGQAQLPTDDYEYDERALRTEIVEVDEPEEEDDVATVMEIFVSEPADEEFDDDATYNRNTVITPADEQLPPDEATIVDVIDVSVAPSAPEFDEPPEEATIVEGPGSMGGSLVSELDTMSGAPVPVEPITTSSRVQNYTILRELGRGGMGFVYLARDERFGREVALKTLSHSQSSSVDLFKREFRSLADIVHPNLATLYELVSDGASWFFTMEYIEGVTFSRYARVGFDGDELEKSDEPPRIVRLRKALDSAVRGLWALHQTGMVHRDIKPSNVMVLRNGQVKLVDFGLVSGTAEEAVKTTVGIQGTIPYMAPEQINGVPASEATDWYAVGVMIYEILVGHRPFKGTGVDVLVTKRDNDAPLRRSSSKDCPKTLVHFVWIC